VIDRVRVALPAQPGGRMMVPTGANAV